MDAGPGWERAALGKLVTLQKERVSGDKDTGLPYIGLEHIAQGQPYLLDVAPSDASVSTNSVFESGDILFGKLRPNLRKSLQVHFRGYCSTDILVLRVGDSYDSSFVARLFQSTSVFEAAIRTSSGTRMPRTSWNSLKSFEVLVPPISKQRRIAEILDTVDEAIRETERVIAKLREVKQGLLHDLLTRGLDAQGHLRDPQAHPEEFKDSPLGRIPREWEVQTCETVCQEITVGIVVKPSQYYVRLGVPALRSTNVQEGQIVLDEVVYISEDANQLQIKSQLRQGDVVTVRTGYPGTSAVVPGWLDGANCIDLVISRPSEKITPQYLTVWINSDFGKEQVFRRQGGLAQQHFNVGEMKELLIALPSLEEQHCITTVLDAHDARIRAEEGVLAKRRQVKQGLMDDLLTGKVRV
jgi:type I restriction enzyme S subunit